MSHSTTHPNSNILPQELPVYLQLDKKIPSISADHCVPETHNTAKANKSSYSAGDTGRLELPSTNFKGDKSYLLIGVTLAYGTDDDVYLREVSDLFATMRLGNDQEEIWQCNDVAKAYALAGSIMRDQDEIEFNKQGSGYAWGAVAQSAVNPVNSAIKVFGTAHNFGLLNAPAVAAGQARIFKGLVDTNQVFYVFDIGRICSFMNQSFIPLANVRSKLYLDFTLKSSVLALQNATAGQASYTMTMEYKYLQCLHSTSYNDILLKQLREADSDPRKSIILPSRQWLVVSKGQLTTGDNTVDLTLGGNYSKVRSVVCGLQLTATGATCLNSVVYNGNPNTNPDYSLTTSLTWQFQSGDGMLYPLIPCTMSKANAYQAIKYLEEIFGTRNHGLVNNIADVYTVDITNANFNVPDFMTKSLIFGHTFVNYPDEQGGDYSCGLDMTKNKLSLSLSSSGIALQNATLWVFYEVERDVALGENIIRVF